MNLLWMSCTTSSLDTKMANLLEVAVALQQDGVVRERRSWKIRPLLYCDDVLYGKYNHTALLAQYRKHYPTEDPAKKLEIFTQDGVPLFFYSVDTLEMLGISDPFELLLVEDAVDPINFLSDLSLVLQAADKKKWTLAGHGTQFLKDILASYVERVESKSRWEHFKSLLNVDYPVDTIPFFRVVNAFRNTGESVSLPRLAKDYGVEVGLTPNSKLNCILHLVDVALSGGENVKLTSGALSTEGAQ